MDELTLLAAVCKKRKAWEALLQLGCTTLASLLASGNHGDETAEALETYKTLVAGETGDDAKDRLEFADFEDDGSERIMLHPALDTYIGEGVRRGHNVAIYGRPNSCKSMLALDISSRMLRP